MQLSGACRHTLFICEIQGKLLRVLHIRVYEPHSVNTAHSMNTKNVFQMFQDIQRPNFAAVLRCYRCRSHWIGEFFVCLDILRIDISDVESISEGPKTRPPTLSSHQKHSSQQFCTMGALLFHVIAQSSVGRPDKVAPPQEN